MKYRESGMPAEELWNTFFDPLQILNQMGVSQHTRTFVDVGCGYGTFVIPGASLASRVIGVDIDEDMVVSCEAKIKEHQLSNVKVIQGDICAPETLASIRQSHNDIDYVALFNILHCEQPLRLLRTVYGLLSPAGNIGVIHWNYDEKTPRGPSMSIRPTPEMIADWAQDAGFTPVTRIELPPYHYGLTFTKLALNNG